MFTYTPHTPYKYHKNHWVVLNKDGSFYCSCDNIQEVREEIESNEYKSLNGIINRGDASSGNSMWVH